MPASFLSLRLMATTLDDQFVTQACTLNTTISGLQLHTAVHFLSFISCKYNFIPWSLLSSSTSFSIFPSPSLFVFHLSLSVKVCLSPGLCILLAPTLAASLPSPISASSSRAVPWSEFNRTQESLCYLDLLTPLIRLSTHQIKPGFPSCIHTKGVLLANQLNCWRQISVRERSLYSELVGGFDQF